MCSVLATHARQWLHAAGLLQGLPALRGLPRQAPPLSHMTRMGCDAFYDCPSWVGFGKKSRVTRPPPCCGIPYSSIGSLNLSHLQCYSYATVYYSSPIKVANRREWSYGIQLNPSLPEDSDFCRSCKTSKGVCGYPNGEDRRGNVTILNDSFICFVCAT